MTFHFPESRTNLMISSAADEFTGCPEYKVNAVRIEKIAADEQGEQAQAPVESNAVPVGK